MNPDEINKILDRAREAYMLDVHSIQGERIFNAAHDVQVALRRNDDVEDIAMKLLILEAVTDQAI